MPLPEQASAAQHGALSLPTELAMSILRCQRGFNLIETMTVMAVSAVLGLTAAPSMSDFLSRQRLTAATQELRLAMELARSEAVARGHRVAIGPVDGRDWRSGWEVYGDLDDDGERDAGDPVLRVFVAPESGVQIETRGLPRTVLSFDDTGYIRWSGSNGLVLGRMVMRYRGAASTVCIAAARIRTVQGDSCA